MKDTKDSFDTLDKKVQSQLFSSRHQALLGLSIPTTLPKAFIHGNITYWESLTCVGFDPYQQVLEAVVQIKQPTGYIGNVCNQSQSFEFVRFFIDFNDGGGWIDFGYRQFKASDISTAPPGPQHPLNYLVRMGVDTTQHQSFLCGNPTIAKVRAVLSWNTPPSANPNAVPFYGDVLDADIQLKRRNFNFADLVPHLNLQTLPAEVSDYQGKIVFDEQLPKPIEIASLHKQYTALKIADDRTFFPMVANSLNKSLLTPASLGVSSANNAISGLLQPINLEDLFDKILNPVKESNTGFEELTCVGLDTNADILGAVVHIKNQAGYGGNLCSTGSNEYVSFWADWNNNGTFDEYLGTSSIRVHDINNMPADGLYYNVNLPISAQVQQHLRSCKRPNVVRIRAVLSWSTPPSTIDPNALPYWGMRRDVLVQIRPTEGVGRGVITGVGNVDRLSILNGYHNYNPVAYSTSAGSGFNRPFGGYTGIQGTLLRPNSSDLLEFKIEWKKQSESVAAYQTVATSGSWSVLDLSTLLTSPVSQSRPDGWFEYLDNFPANKKVLGDYLVGFSSGVVTDEAVTLRVSVRVNGGPEVVVDEFDLQIDNTPTITSPTPNASVDMSSDVDIVIDGLDCKLYKKGVTTQINGHLRAKHRHFNAWQLDLQPSAHANGAAPTPNFRAHGSVNDPGNDNLPWSLDLTPMDECGYTVSLVVSSRVIQNSTPILFPTVGVKYVGFGYFS